MTVHFAASRLAAHSPVARVLQRHALAAPANDNFDDRADDEMLYAALHHFARFGLGAAREARRYAEQAFFAGDRERYDRWLGICRKLDARLAASLETATTGRADRMLRPASDG